MANITITGNVTVDIHLENITMEAYNKLTAFLAGLEGKTEPAEQPKVEQPYISGERITGERADKHSRRYTIDNLLKQDNSKEYCQYLLDAQQNPDRYDWVWRTSKAVKPTLPAPYCNMTDGRPVGHFLGMFATVGLLRKRVSDKGETEFCVPMLKAQAKPPVESMVQAAPPTSLTTTLNYRDQRVGEQLRNARKSANLTLSDLSRAIGYDTSIINKWETGTYHMAETQRKTVCDYFHRDIFADVTA